MIKALRLQEKTAQVGFEWENVDQVKAKVDEEMIELQTNIQNNCTQEEIEDEYGDLLFALINYARFLKIDPETALEKTNRKFIRRFEYIERLAQKPLSDMSLDEMDLLWEEAKHME
jgi:XTP/dITP diphosphohydrolase